MQPPPTLTTPPPTLAARLGVVTGLRGVAFLAVLYHHLLSSWTPAGWASLQVAGHALSVGAPLTHGYVGVHLFFVLSGLVMYLPYADGRRTMTTRADLWAFYRRRASRLLPLYYVSLVVTLALVAPPPATLAGLRHVLLLATFTFPFTTSAWSPSTNWVLWSLGIEVWLSVLFPLLIVVAQRHGIRRLLLGAITLALGVRMLGHGSPTYFVGNPYLDALSDSVLGRLDDFVLGMAVVVAWRARPSGPGAALVLVGSALAWLGCVARDAVVLGQLPASAWPITHLVLAVGFALVALGALRCVGIVRALLACAPLQLIGLMSYSLYVWHDLVIRHVVHGIVDGAHLAMAGLLLAALASLTYRYVEFGSEPSWRRLFTPTK